MTEEQWKAISTNDKSYDGTFFYCLKTTKNICKPSCSARACNRENVIIFNTYEAALSAGFKPCSRCRPENLNWKGAKDDLAKKALSYLETHYREKFSLKQIAAALYVNGNYLLGAFKEITGHTLLWYHNHIRCEKAAKLLENSCHNITYISDTTGFVNPSHFARVFKSYYNMTPGEYRKAYFESTSNKK